MLPFMLVGDRGADDEAFAYGMHDEHLWAETYDRSFSDVFALQAELTRAVAEQLQATLPP